MNTFNSEEPYDSKSSIHSFEEDKMADKVPQLISMNFNSNNVPSLPNNLTNLPVDNREAVNSNKNIKLCFDSKSYSKNYKSEVSTSFSPSKLREFLTSHKSSVKNEENSLENFVLSSKTKNSPSVKKFAANNCQEFDESRTEKHPDKQAEHENDYDDLACCVSIYDTFGLGIKCFIILENNYVKIIK